MKVDVRQIEEAVAQLDRMLNELQDASKMVEEVSRCLRVQRIGNEETTLRIRESLLKEQATLNRREAGLRSLRSVLYKAAHSYEACEKRALKHATSWQNQIFYAVDFDFNRFIPTEFVEPIFFKKTIDSLIRPLVGKEGR